MALSQWGRDMKFLSKRQRNNLIYKTISLFITFNFLVGSIFPAGVSAQTIAQLSSLNIAIQPGVVFNPATIKGITLYPDNPLKFDFIIDQGDTHLQGEEFKKEAAKLIKYFMASLTVPEDQTWVNLSPYEKDRIIPKDFSATEMGQDMLVQDYLLKQLTASMMHPESELGKTFWNRVYQKTQEKFGTKDIPVNTFNKIWIMPEKAFVYEHNKGAFIVGSHLKVMLEEDYLALEHNKNNPNNAIGVDAQKLTKLDEISTQIIREVLIPEIEKEVNEGKTFANLRQIYNSMILATWYKQALKESILGQVYADKNKINGIKSQDQDIKEKVYNQYLETFKKGAYDFIKEDYDPQTQTVIPRKYFSGGITAERLKGALAAGKTDYAALASNPDKERQVMAAAESIKDGDVVTMEIQGSSPATGKDSAMLAQPIKQLKEALNEKAEVLARMREERNRQTYVSSYLSVRKEAQSIYDTYFEGQRSITFVDRDQIKQRIDQLFLVSSFNHQRLSQIAETFQTNRPIELFVALIDLQKVLTYGRIPIDAAMLGDDIARLTQILGLDYFSNAANIGQLIMDNVDYRKILEFIKRRSSLSEQEIEDQLWRQKYAFFKTQKLRTQSTDFDKTFNGGLIAFPFPNTGFHLREALKGIIGDSYTYVFENDFNRLIYAQLNGPQFIADLARKFHLNEEGVIQRFEQYHLFPLAVQQWKLKKMLPDSAMTAAINGTKISGQDFAMIAQDIDKVEKALEKTNPETLSYMREVLEKGISSERRLTLKYLSAYELAKEIVGKFKDHQSLTGNEAVEIWRLTENILDITMLYFEDTNRKIDEFYKIDVATALQSAIKKLQRTLFAKLKAINIPTGRDAAMTAAPAGPAQTLLIESNNPAQTLFSEWYDWLKQNPEIAGLALNRNTEDQLSVMALNKRALAMTIPYRHYRGNAYVIIKRDNQDKTKIKIETRGLPGIGEDLLLGLFDWLKGRDFKTVQLDRMSDEGWNVLKLLFKKWKKLGYIPDGSPSQVVELVRNNIIEHHVLIDLDSLDLKSWKEDLHTRTEMLKTRNISLPYISQLVELIEKDVAHRLDPIFEETDQFGKSDSVSEIIRSIFVGQDFERILSILKADHPQADFTEVENFVRRVKAHWSSYLSELDKSSWRNSLSQSTFNYLREKMGLDKDAAMTAAPAMGKEDAAMLATYSLEELRNGDDFRKQIEKAKGFTRYESGNPVNLSLNLYIDGKHELNLPERVETDKARDTLLEVIEKKHKKGQRYMVSVLENNVQVFSINVPRIGQQLLEDLAKAVDLINQEDPDVVQRMRAVAEPYEDEGFSFEGGYLNALRRIQEIHAGLEKIIASKSASIGRLNSILQSLEYATRINRTAGGWDSELSFRTVQTAQKYGSKLAQQILDAVIQAERNFENQLTDAAMMTEEIQKLDKLVKDAYLKVDASPFSGWLKRTSQFIDDINGKGRRIIIQNKTVRLGQKTMVQEHIDYIRLQLEFLQGEFPRLYDSKMALAILRQLDKTLKVMLKQRVIVTDAAMTAKQSTVNNPQSTAVSGSIDAAMIADLQKTAVGKFMLNLFEHSDGENKTLLQKSGKDYILHRLVRNNVGMNHDGGWDYANDIRFMMAHDTETGSWQMVFDRVTLSWDGQKVFQIEAPRFRNLEKLDGKINLEQDPFEQIVGLRYFSEMFLSGGKIEKFENLVDLLTLLKTEAQIKKDGLIFSSLPETLREVLAKNNITTMAQLRSLKKENLGDLDGIKDAPHKQAVEIIDALVKAQTSDAAILGGKESTDISQQATELSTVDSGPRTKGGIDFNPKALDLNIKRDGKGIPLPVSQQPMEQFMKLDTFAPVIINVAPIQNLPLLLGLKDEDKEPKELSKAL